MVLIISLDWNNKENPHTIGYNRKIIKNLSVSFRSILSDFPKLVVSPMDRYYLVAR